MRVTIDPDQVWEIDVQLPVDRIESPADVHAIEAAFHAAHEEVFGIRDDASHIEIVGWTATASVRLHDVVDFAATQSIGADTFGPGYRRAYFAETGPVDVPVHRLAALSTTGIVAGPAIVDSAFTTVVVPPGSYVRRAGTGSLIITQH